MASIAIGSRRIDPFLKERYVDSGLLPNAQILIARDGEIAHFSSIGSAREGGAAVDDRALFRIASMTKPITSVAFMMLVEQGKVALDTPVHHVLPEFKNVGVYEAGGGQAPFATRPTTQPMRMVDLLRHTSGLTYGFQNRSNIDAAYRERKLESWHGHLSLDRICRRTGQAAARVLAGRGVELFGLHRRARRGDPARVRHGAGRVISPNTSSPRWA